MSNFNTVVNINLESPNPSRVFETFSYPGGELQTRLNKDRGDYIINDLKSDTSVKINLTAKIRSSEDLVVLAQVCDIIRNLRDSSSNVKGDEFNLTLPYLPYGRADRRFTGDVDTIGLGVFLVLLDSIVTQYYIDNVYTLDMHPSLEKYLKVEDHITVEKRPLVQNIEPTRYIFAAIKETLAYAETIAWNAPVAGINLLFPDKGAYERYSNMFPKMAMESNVGAIHYRMVFCNKARNLETGEFLGFEVPEASEFLPDAPILIIDDICDGGGTFLGISRELDKNGIHENRFLYVTHGIFSKGVSELVKDFERIYTTDSFHTRGTDFGPYVKVLS